MCSKLTLNHTQTFFQQQRVRLSKPQGNGVSRKQSGIWTWLGSAQGSASLRTLNVSPSRCWRLRPLSGAPGDSCFLSQKFTLPKPIEAACPWGRGTALGCGSLPCLCAPVGALPGLLKGSLPPFHSSPDPQRVLALGGVAARSQEPLHLVRCF